jgi:hypothetical protein
MKASLLGKNVYQIMRNAMSVLPITQLWHAYGKRFLHIAEKKTAQNERYLTQIILFVVCFSLLTNF